MPQALVPLAKTCLMSSSRPAFALIATSLFLVFLPLSSSIASSLDTSYFESNIKLPGTAGSNNPYDAIPGALVANFNTVFASKQNGVIVSAEEQTPITVTARRIYNTMQGRSKRVNTGPDHRIAERYFAELVAEFLRREKVDVGGEIAWG